MIKLLKYTFLHASVVLLLTALAPNTVFAQQTAQFSLWQLNKFAAMPAYAGIDGSLSTTAAYRRQWTGLAGSPATFHFNAHLPWYLAHGAVGMSFENDELGAEKNTSATATYAYHITIADNHILSAAIGLGFIQKTLDGTILTPANSDIPDQNIPQGKMQALSPVIQAGPWSRSIRRTTGSRTRECST